jgi:hypothetical protein
MMPQNKEFTAYKDHFQTLAALIGVLSVVLYVFGYVAERVHWNMLGIIQVPADHIEFLYRGGNVVISSLVSALLYPIMSLVEPSLRTLLLFGVILLMLVAIFVRGPGKSFGIYFSRYSLAASLLLLLVLSISELGNWPESRKDLLFLPAPADSSAPDPAAFFQSYVGLLALWLAFYFTCRRIETIAAAARKGDSSTTSDKPNASASFLFFDSSTWFVTMAATGEGGKAGSDAQASVETPTPWGVSVWARRVALFVALVLLVGLPLIYGSFRFPHEYPIVRVLLAGNASSELKNSSSSLLHAGDLKNPVTFASKLQTRKDPLSLYLWTQLRPATQQAVSTKQGTVPEETQKVLIDDLNRLLQNSDFFNRDRFSQVNLSEEARNRAGQNPDGEELVRTNRLLLAEAYPEEIARAQHYFGQAGDAMALLYETAGEYVLYHKSAQPAVLRLKKAEVEGFVVYQSKDITTSSLDIKPVESRP